MIGLATDGIEIWEERLGFDVPNFVFWIIIIAIVIAVMRYLWEREVRPIVTEVKDIHSKIDKTDRIDILEQGQHDIIDETRKRDEQLDEKIRTVSEKVDALIERMDAKIDGDNEIRRNQLKDRIRQNYGYYHNNGYITPMELEALQGLIESYEKCGGKNSFVHSIIEPEMYTWEIREHGN